MLEFIGCVQPTGDYLTSCSNVNLETYVSPDPLVPKACLIEADCQTIYSGLPPTHNIIYFPSDTLLNGVYNNNGTLYYSAIPLAKSESIRDLECIIPNGSYSQTCDIKIGKYQSTDPNLINTSLCNADLSCLKLDGKTSSTVVYFNIRDKEITAQKIENCDGSLVLGNVDYQCAGKDPKTIKEISEKDGNSGVIKW